MKNKADFLFEESMLNHSITCQRELIIPSDAKYLDDVPDFTDFTSNTIIHKTVTGIGATYSELESDRNSIIVLPNIAIIKDKYHNHKGKQKLFPVFGDMDVNTIKRYFLAQKGIVKFITTPNGLKKIDRALGENKKDYFLLFDECHRLVQDIHYRKDLLDAIDLFFSFQQKALISATPLPFSDPRFEEQKFTRVLIKPSVTEQLPVSLISSNSVISSIKTHLASDSADCYCIFFNSVKGILNIVEKLKLEQESNIFCSENSKLLLKLKKMNRVHSEYREGAKFNFFTSSFFNGLDILIDETKTVDIIIITDVSSASHSLVDPHTDVIQIAGRLRRKLKDFNLIHINNASSWTSTGGVPDAKIRLEDSGKVYLAVETLKQSTDLSDLADYLNNLLTYASPYSHMIYNKKYSQFLEDNYLNEARVSSYYNRPSALYKAYSETRRFFVMDEAIQYAKSEIQHITNRLLHYRKPNIRMAIEALDEITIYKGTDDYIKALKSISNLFPEIVTAYERLGSNGIAEADYNFRKIKRQLFNLDIEERKVHYPLIHLIHNEFKLNKKYLFKNAKGILQDLADSLNLNVKMLGTDVARYFEIKEVNVFIEGRSNSGFVPIYRKLEQAQENLEDKYMI